VIFSVYESDNNDSDNSVDTVHYDFFDGEGNTVAVDNSETNLFNLTRDLIKGQSFTIAQKFTNARGKNVSRVKVTIREKNGDTEGAMWSLALTPGRTASAVRNVRSGHEALKAGPAVVSSVSSRASNRNRRGTRR